MPTSSVIRVLLSKKRSRNFKKAIAKFSNKLNTHKFVKDV